MQYIQTYFECFKASGTDTTLQIIGLSVHFHPSVGLTPAEAQSFAEKWKANFIKCLERAI